MKVFVQILMVHFLLGYGLIRGQDESNVTCQSNCTLVLPEDITRGVATPCEMNTSFKEGETIPRYNICVLNLSYMGKRYVPPGSMRGYSRLENLSLAHNEIIKIGSRAFRGASALESLDLSYNQLRSLKPSAFEGLTSLVHLNLRYNKLLKWSGTLSQQLPVVLNLFLWGNENLTLSSTFFVNTTLRFIEGTAISKKCRECNFTRLKQESSVVKYQCQYVPDEFKSQYKELIAEAIIFDGDCNGRRCELDVTEFGSKAKALRRNGCWDVIRKLIPLEFSLGALAILFNAFLIAVVLTAKPLRTSSTYVIAAHVALCDVFRGMYAVLLATGHVSASDVGFSQWRKLNCPYYRSVFLLAEIMGCATCLLATVERYLGVVYCMKPAVRMTRNITLLSLAGVWLVGVVFCLLIETFDAVNIVDNKMCLLIRNTEKHDVFFVEITLFSLIILYLIGVGLYVRIFVFAAQTGQNLGISRESRLAKKIGFLVISNLLFLLGPNLAMFVFIYDSNTEFYTASAIVLRMWLPPMCLVFNSCVNPWYFCFRSEKFINALQNIRHCHRYKRNYLPNKQIRRRKLSFGKNRIHIQNT